MKETLPFGAFYIGIPIENLPISLRGTLLSISGLPVQPDLPPQRIAKNLDIVISYIKGNFLTIFWPFFHIFGR